MNNVTKETFIDNRDFKGIWIPKELWFLEGLTPVEKLLLVEIDSLDNKEHCHASNTYFSEFLGVSEKTISRAIKKLIDLGYVKQIHFDGRIRILSVNYGQNVYQGGQNVHMDGQTVQAQGTNCPAINIDNNIDNRIVNSIGELSTAKAVHPSVLINKGSRECVPYTNYSMAPLRTAPLEGRSAKVY